MIKSGEFSAEVWVNEWLDAIKKHPEIPKDEEMMLAWFANAIMAGYDRAYQEMNKPQTLTMIDNKWVTARPLIAPFYTRLKNAWRVLVGKADAIEYYKQ